MGQKSCCHRQALAQRIQRLVAAIGQHRIGLRIQRISLLAARAAPPHHGQTIGQRRMNFGQQACKPACKQGLGTGQLAHGRGFDQQPTNQAPQRQRRHIARPAVHQQIRPEGTHCAPLGRGLKTIQHRRVGKVLGHKAFELRGAKGLEKARQAKANHIGVIAADHGQPGLGLLAISVIAIEQARHGAVNHIDDLGDCHAAQMLGRSITHPVCQCLHLRARQHGHRHVQPCAIALKGQHMPLHLVVAQPRQITGLDLLHLAVGRHALAAFTNSSTAREQPLAAAPSARPSNKKPPSAHRPTSSVRMVLTEL